jgi:hypothetical protein
MKKTGDATPEKTTSSARSDDDKMEAEALKSGKCCSDCSCQCPCSGGVCECKNRPRQAVDGSGHMLKYGSET